ncbi:MAG TPA: GNAT family N-acetyltransferase [Streptosporangiaceae bacterium]
MPQLATPTTLVRESFLEAVRDLRDEGWLPQFPVEQVSADFESYVRDLILDTRGWGVPITTLWYVDGETYLGTVIVRHGLTPELRRRGGHIGYHVAPRHRRQGHATALLAETIGYTRRALGLTWLLLTCDERNAASRRVIEANAGTLEDILDGECRYWIAPEPGTTAP